MNRSTPACRGVLAFALFAVALPGWLSPRGVVSCALGDTLSAQRHSQDCPVTWVLLRESPAPLVLHYVQQDTEIDAVSGVERQLSSTEAAFASDGKSWCIRSGGMIASGKGAEVTQWDLVERVLTVLPRGSTPQYESVIFLLTQAQEFNVVIPRVAFLPSCTCSARERATAADAGVEVGVDAAASKHSVTSSSDFGGWKHTIATEVVLGKTVVSWWELAIPRSASPGADSSERRIRVEVTERDVSGEPIKITRVVEDWKDGVNVRVLGRSALIVTERRAFDPQRDARLLQTPTLADGWSVIDTTRELEYVYGLSGFSVEGVEFFTKSPLRLAPFEFRLRDFLRAAQSK